MDNTGACHGYIRCNETISRLALECCRWAKVHVDIFAGLYWDESESRGFVQRRVSASKAKKDWEEICAEGLYV
jgi:hypothetical protein